MPSESMNQKIKKLLALAERAGTPAEAEAASKAAERLMIKWGIEEAMLRAEMKEGDKQEEIVVKYSAPYPKLLIKARGTVSNSVVLGMGNLKCWWSPQWSMDNKRMEQTLAIAGFESDVDRAHMLVTSILTQADHALAYWWKNYPLRSSLTAAESLRAKREFLFGFGAAVRRRLVEMRDVGIVESDNIAANKGTSTALVLRDRGKQVDDWYNEHYARGMRKSRGLKGSAHGRSAGDAAGRSANLGGKSLGGTRGAIER